LWGIGFVNKKIVGRARLRAILRKLQASGKRVVFTNGCFDIIHAGHVRYLRKARSLGDLLVIGMNSDKSVRRLKGRGRPLVKEADRAELLAALEMVDCVTIFDEDTPASLIEALKPDVLVKGGDYGLKEVVGRETVKASGGRVVIVPLVKGRSTTGLIKKIRGSSQRR
jgi:D-beta-D-heptose 7-phosphate kinase/D-beta-D-heptose 1-phosphate adenosyltransferase